MLRSLPRMATSTMHTSKVPAERLWLSLDLPRDSLSQLHLTENPDPTVNSSFRLGTVAQTVIGLSGLAAAHIHKLRTGVVQNVSVDARHAVIEFKSEGYYLIDDKQPPGDLWDDLAGTYKTKDNNYVRIHTSFPHHRQGILDILQCAPTRDAIAQSLLQRDSVEFETEAAKRKMVATAMRSFREWDEHPQGKALAGVLPVSLRKVGNAPKRSVIGGRRPLEGLRVLDLTRVLAGPVCGRTLAAHGADVLLITSPKLPSLPFLDTDTSRSKRTTQLDLTEQKGRDVLSSLVKDTDVFLQAYRPGGLADKGFGVEDVVRARPGVVYASLTAYGWEGPWSDRRGFDSLVQTATGFNVAEAEAFATYKGNKSEYPLPPKPLPMQALDHAAGYLLATGIQAAIAKTIIEGGSWEVRVSLEAVSQWVRSLGQLNPEVAFGEGSPLPPTTVPPHPEISDLLSKYEQSGENLQAMQESRKVVSAIRHAAVLEKTPVREEGAPIVLGANSPMWLLRE